jgi:hypothetical protein
MISRLAFTVGFALTTASAGVPVTPQSFPGVPHEFFVMGAIMDTSKEAVKVAADALKTAFAK